MARHRHVLWCPQKRLSGRLSNHLQWPILTDQHLVLLAVMRAFVCLFGTIEEYVKQLQDKETWWIWAWWHWTIVISFALDAWGVMMDRRAGAICTYAQGGTAWGIWSLPRTRLGLCQGTRGWRQWTMIMKTHATHSTQQAPKYFQQPRRMHHYPINMVIGTFSEWCSWQGPPTWLNKWWGNFGGRRQQRFIK